MQTNARTYELLTPGDDPNLLSHLHTSFDAKSGLERIDYVPCYARGTAILTARGEIPVEALQQGDRVVTVLGQGPALKPVVWVGTRRIRLDRVAHPQRVAPVRIRAGALDDGVPHRDLLVSPDHALLLGGCLVHADTLINGVTIVQEFPAEIEYFHVEVPMHDVLLAEGAAAESYLDTGNRAGFGNNALVRLHAEPKMPAAIGCLPFVREGEAWVRAVTRLVARAASLGYVRRTEPALHLTVDGAAAQAQDLGGGRWAFEIPEGAREVRLCSPASHPWFVHAGSDDRRRLGVALGRLAYIGPDGRLDLAPADHWPGCHELEWADGVAFRWTSGEATLPPPPDRGRCSLSVEIVQSMPYWRLNAQATSAWSQAA